MASDTSDAFVVAPALEDEFGELRFCFGKLLAGDESFDFCETLLDQFHATSLDREVGLRKSDLRLLWIALESRRINP